MASFNEKQRAFCVREYYRNNDSSTVAQRKFCAHYNIRHKNKAPSIQSIKKWVQKFEETGSTIDKPRSGRPRTSRDPATLEELKARIREEMQNISRNTCQSVIENFCSRLQQCQNNEGSHMDDVIFKK